MIAESAFVLVVIRLLHGVSERPAISSQSVSQFSEVSESDLVGVEEKQQSCIKSINMRRDGALQEAVLRKHTRASETGC